MKGKRSVVLIIVILVAIIIIAIMAIGILGNRDNDGEDNIGTNDNYYAVTPDGSKVNTSEDVSEDKKVGDIVIEQSKITYVNGVSKLTSIVKNDSTARENLRFTVKFVADDGSIIAESVGYVGNIRPNETKYIDSDVTSDVSNAKNIVYEIIE